MRLVSSWWVLLEALLGPCALAAEPQRRLATGLAANLALGKEVLLSSVGSEPYPSSGVLRAGDGFRLVDGDRGTNFFAGAGCAQTMATPDPWARIDFGTEVPVAEVRLWTRTDAGEPSLGPLELYIGNAAHSFVENTLCGMKANKTDSGVNGTGGLQLSRMDQPTLGECSGAGRYLWVVLRFRSATSKALSLCEVEVAPKGPTGTEHIMQTEGTMFDLELSGLSFHSGDRIRIVGDQVWCGLKGSAIMSSGVLDLTAPMGSRHDGNATWEMWRNIQINYVGIFKVCWCGNVGTCSNDEDFSMHVTTLIVNGVITTGGGNGTAPESEMTVFDTDGLPATEVPLDGPFGVAASGDRVYVSEITGHRLRWLDMQRGTMWVLSGGWVQGYFGDGGRARDALLARPAGIGLSVDHTTLYIADSANHRVRSIAVGGTDPSYGMITTVAGNGHLGFSGDGGLAVEAQLNTPTCATVDLGGRLWICDRMNNRIRVVALGETVFLVPGSNEYRANIILTAGGDGIIGLKGDGGLSTEAQFGSPNALAVSHGHVSEDVGELPASLYIAEENTHQIRSIALEYESYVGVVRTLAGGGTPGDAVIESVRGQAGATTLTAPQGVAAENGMVFVSDTINNRLLMFPVMEYISIGCWRENHDIPWIPLIEPAEGETDEFLDGVPDMRSEKIKKCALAALRRGFTAFAVRRWGSCAASATAELDYQREGTSTSCLNGLGGTRDNSVYRFSRSGGHVEQLDFAYVVAGREQQGGFEGDMGPAWQAQLNNPTGLAVNPVTHDLWIADTGNNRLRLVFSQLGPNRGHDTTCINGYPCHVTLAGNGLQSNSSLGVVPASWKCGQQGIEFAMGFEFNPLQQVPSPSFVLKTFNSGRLSVKEVGAFRLCYCAHGAQVFGAISDCSEPQHFIQDAGHIHVLGTDSVLKYDVRAGISFDLFLKGISLAYLDTIRIIAHEHECGTMGANKSSDAVADMSLTDGPRVFGNTTWSLWPGVMLMQAGDFRVCWCHGVELPGQMRSCQSAEDFTFHTASIRVYGPRYQTMYISMSAGESIKLEGEGLGAGDRIRIVDDNVHCGSPGALDFSMAVDPASVPRGTADRITANGAVWQNVLLRLSDKNLSVCWCGALNGCSTGADFNILAATIVVQGPDLNPFMEVEVGIFERFSLNVTGMGFTGQERMAVVKADTCGSTNAGLMTPDMNATGAAGPPTSAEPMRLEWSNLQLLRTGTYRVCYCGGVCRFGSCCSTGRDYFLEIGAIFVDVPSFTYSQPALSRAVVVPEPKLTVPPPVLWAEVPRNSPIKMMLVSKTRHAPNAGSAGPVWVSVYSGAGHVWPTRFELTGLVAGSMQTWETTALLEQAMVPAGIVVESRGPDAWFCEYLELKIDGLGSNLFPVNSWTVLPAQRDAQHAADAMMPWLYTPMHAPLPFDALWERRWFAVDPCGGCSLGFECIQERVPLGTRVLREMNQTYSTISDFQAQCRPLCGDGYAAPGEQCDDGNMRSLDGCSSDCQVESGFECVNFADVPSRCYIRMCEFVSEDGEFTPTPALLRRSAQLGHMCQDGMTPPSDHLMMCYPWSSPFACPSSIEIADIKGYIFAAGPGAQMGCHMSDTTLCVPAKAPRPTWAVERHGSIIVYLDSPAWRQPQDMMASDFSCAPLLTSYSFGAVGASGAACQWVADDILLISPGPMATLGRMSGFDTARQLFGDPDVLFFQLTSLRPRGFQADLMYWPPELGELQVPVRRGDPLAFQDGGLPHAPHVVLRGPAFMGGCADLVVSADTSFNGGGRRWWYTKWTCLETRPDPLLPLQDRMAAYDACSMRIQPLLDSRPWCGLESSDKGDSAQPCDLRVVLPADAWCGLYMIRLRIDLTAANGQASSAIWTTEIDPRARVPTAMNVGPTRMQVSPQRVPGGPLPRVRLEIATGISLLNSTETCACNLVSNPYDDSAQVVVDWLYGEIRSGVAPLSADMQPVPADESPLETVLLLPFSGPMLRPESHWQIVARVSYASTRGLQSAYVRFTVDVGPVEPPDVVISYAPRVFNQACPLVVDASPSRIRELVYRGGRRLESSSGGEEDAASVEERQLGDANDTQTDMQSTNETAPPQSLTFTWKCEPLNPSALSSHGALLQLCSTAGRRLEAEPGTLNRGLYLFTAVVTDTALPGIVGEAHATIEIMEDAWTPLMPRGPMKPLGPAQDTVEVEYWLMGGGPGCTGSPDGAFLVAMESALGLPLSAMQVMSEVPILREERMIDGVKTNVIKASLPKAAFHLGFQYIFRLISTGFYPTELGEYRDVLVASRRTTMNLHNDSTRIIASDPPAPPAGIWITDTDPFVVLTGPVAGTLEVAMPMGGRGFAMRDVFRLEQVWVTDDPPLEYSYVYTQVNDSDSDEFQTLLSAGSESVEAQQRLRALIARQPMAPLRPWTQDPVVEMKLPKGRYIVEGHVRDSNGVEATCIAAVEAVDVFRTSGQMPTDPPPSTTSSSMASTTPPVIVEEDPRNSSVHNLMSYLAFLVAIRWFLLRCSAVRRDPRFWPSDSELMRIFFVPAEYQYREATRRGSARRDLHTEWWPCRAKFWQQLSNDALVFSRKVQGTLRALVGFSMFLSLEVQELRCMRNDKRNAMYEGLYEQLDDKMKPSDEPELVDAFCRAEPEPLPSSTLLAWDPLEPDPAPLPALEGFEVPEMQALADTEPHPFNFDSGAPALEDGPPDGQEPPLALPALPDGAVEDDEALGPGEVEERDVLAQQAAQTMMQDPSLVEALPAGWEQHAAEDGMPYYYNTLNGDSTWDRPHLPAEAYLSAQVQEPALGNSIGAGGPVAAGFAYGNSMASPTGKRRKRADKLGTLRGAARRRDVRPEDLVPDDEDGEAASPSASPNAGAGGGSPHTLRSAGAADADVAIVPVLSQRVLEQEPAHGAPPDDDGEFQLRAQVWQAQVLAAANEEVPVPNGWEMRHTADGHEFYVHEALGLTQWTWPRLPLGWEERLASDGRVYYLSLLDGRTQWDWPAESSAKMPTLPGSTQEDATAEEATAFPALETLSRASSGVVAESGPPADAEFRGEGADEPRGDAEQDDGVVLAIEPEPEDAIALALAQVAPEPVAEVAPVPQEELIENKPSAVLADEAWSKLKERIRLQKEAYDQRYGAAKLVPGIREFLRPHELEGHVNNWDKQVDYVLDRLDKLERKHKRLGYRAEMDKAELRLVFPIIQRLQWTKWPAWQIFLHALMRALPTVSMVLHCAKPTKYHRCLLHIAYESMLLLGSSLVLIKKAPVSEDIMALDQSPADLLNDFFTMPVEATTLAAAVLADVMGRMLRHVLAKAFFVPTISSQQPPPKTKPGREANLRYWQELGDFGKWVCMTGIFLAVAGTIAACALLPQPRTTSAARAFCLAMLWGHIVFPLLSATCTTIVLVSARNRRYFDGLLTVIPSFMDFHHVGVKTGDFLAWRMEQIVSELEIMRRVHHEPPVVGGPSDPSKYDREALTNS